MNKVFLDTSVLLGKVLKLSRQAERVFTDPDIEKYTNEYALKEMYHVLKKNFKFSEIQISYAIDYVRQECIILPSPKKEEIQSIKIRDKADRPIVYSAKKYDLILYIDDEKTYQDSKKYAKVRRISKN
ncbi:MAG: hypothetical protein U9R75_07775 [Candidatus Thermoplasmatota archaeon]|nr:hypothetical protein [Candidatus Thermoplasmatota archaeon]